MPSPEPSPRPWCIGESASGTMSCIHDAKGEHIVSCFGIPTEADAALIVDAVNNEESWRDAYIKARTECNALLLERDRLRDIVREALPFIEGAIDGVSTILGDAEMSKAAGECGAPPKDVMEAFVADGRRILREARAAIGENAPRTEEKGGDK